MADLGSHQNFEFEEPPVTPAKFLMVCGLLVLLAGGVSWFLYDKYVVQPREKAGPGADFKRPVPEVEAGPKPISREQLRADYQGKLKDLENDLPRAEEEASSLTKRVEAMRLAYERAQRQRMQNSKMLTPMPQMEDYYEGSPLTKERLATAEAEATAATVKRDALRASIQQCNDGLERLRMKDLQAAEDRREREEYEALKRREKNE